MLDCEYDPVDPNCGPFLQAALDGDPEKLEHQLIAGAGVNQIDQYGGTALILAGKNGHIECVNYLLKSGADVNIHDSSGMTAVMWAADKGFEEILKILIKAGADVNARTLSSLRGATALGMAIKRTCVNCVKILLESGADVNRCGFDTFSALHIAAQSCYSPKRSSTDLWFMPDNFVSRHVEMSIEEIDFYKTQEPTGVTAALECLRLLLKSGADVNVLNKHGHNSLQSFIIECTPLIPEMALLLLAAGETIEGDSIEKVERFGRTRSVKIPDFLRRHKEDISLKNICVEKIRSHLLSVDKNTNLFVRIPKLLLPTIVTDFLLLDMKLE